ncbi:response regulator [Candidatus Marsarchaeota archaeon]|nr:response regulator [Candidatus Marsarchaeota archaeon]MCL5405038.1 response regulator [Candidatus Marsarchaeota archaeon]
MVDFTGFANELYVILNERQQVSYSELKDMAFSRGISLDTLKGSLEQLENAKAIASRSRGGILTYYILQEPNSLRKVLIVEDDKNINKLMAISIGKGFEINQIYDGGEAIDFVKRNRPDLVILDIMLPNKDGLDICQTIKSDPSVSNTVVILVSAMDPTSNRFTGIKNGADYYIKKPFDPIELRSLVTLFLRKKGKRFDPLIDLPDEDRISAEIEHSLKEGEHYVIGTIRIDSLGTYAKRFGGNSGVVILRLISQLLQDIIKGKAESVFVGFLNSDEFVIAGMESDVAAAVKNIQQEFNAVLPFIVQDEGYRKPDLDLESLFESKEVPKLSLVYTPIEKEKLKERRNEILENKAASGVSEIGSYTYEELQKLFGREDLDIIITRDSNGVKLQVGKNADGSKIQ